MKILACDRDELVREGIRFLTEQNAGWSYIDGSASSSNMLDLFKTVSVDMAILDSGLETPETMSVIPLVREIRPACKIVILAVATDQYRLKSYLAAGADGIILKGAADARELISAIPKIMSGEKFVSSSLIGVLFSDCLAKKDSGSAVAGLTHRESAVIRLISQGYGSKEIAYHLGVSVKTVDRVRAGLLKRAGVRNAAQLVHWAETQER